MALFSGHFQEILYYPIRKEITQPKKQRKLNKGAIYQGVGRWSKDIRDCETTRIEQKVFHK